MSDHPTATELVQFANGELEDARFEAVAAHLDDCEFCEAVLRKTGAFKGLPLGVDVTEASGRAIVMKAGDATTASPIAEGRGSIVGPYKLLQPLGEGGMGVVYMAEQERPVRRKVALMMDHHHIAKVLDAGTTNTGRPYFAMELVKGVPITEYCDKNKLTPRERLEMFVPVCHAIQHAHQKGIIHRDIKPSNVLVTLYDGKPVPKVIDFGIAKATQQKLTERTMFTGIGQILGTLEYMSPEQAEMNQLDIDTRSDVYSLGVMLYELLTGSTPITKEKFRDAGLEEMLRTIRETEPPKPSTRLSDSGEALPSISAVRKTEPTKLSKLVRGDLDWIVMKALEKDRTRRYETANGLAVDIDRFLKDEAVEACPPSASYRLRKFARRNKAAIATTASIACILMLSTVLSSWLAYRAIKAEGVASRKEQEATDALIAVTKAKEEAEKQRKLAEENATKAAREATKSNAVATFLKDMLKGVGPSVALGRDTKMLQEILETTEKRLDSDLTGQPEVEAELRTTIGKVFSELGLRKEAKEQHERAHQLRVSFFGEESAKTAESIGHLARLTSDRKLRLALSERALKIRRRISTRDSNELSLAMHEVAFDLSTIYPWAHEPSADYQSNQQRAIQLGTGALAMARRVNLQENDSLAKIVNNQAALLMNIHRHSDEAISLFSESLRISESVEHPDSPDLNIQRNNVAYAMMQCNRAADALPLYRDVLERSRRVLGLLHPSTIRAVQNLLWCLERNGNDSEWDELFDDTLNTAKSELDSSDYRLANLYVTQGDNRGVRGDYAGTLAAYRAAAEATIDQVESPSQHYRQFYTETTQLCCGHFIRGDMAVARKLRLELLEVLKRRATCLTATREDQIQVTLARVRTLLENDDWPSLHRLVQSSEDIPYHEELEWISSAAMRVHQFEATLAESGLTASDRIRLAIQFNFHPYRPEQYRLFGKSHEAALYAWFRMNDEHIQLCHSLLPEGDLFVSLDSAAKPYLISPNDDPRHIAEAYNAAFKDFEQRKYLPHKRAWSAFGLGLACYRTEKMGDAAEYLRLARKEFNQYREPSACFVLAMLHRRAGDSHKAASYFELGEGQLHPRRPPGRALDDAHLVLTHNHDKVVAWLLHDEARNLLAEAKTQSDK